MSLAPDFQKIATYGSWKGAKFVWAGANSFEDRALTSLEGMLARGAICEKAYLLDYSSAVHPKEIGEEKKRRNLVRVQELSRQAGFELQVVPLAPYVMDPALSTFRFIEGEVLATYSPNFFLDLSCMTKIDVLASSYFASRHHGTAISILYTIPDQYGTPAADKVQSIGWTEPLVAPIVYDPSNYYPRSYGVVLPGHEGRRLKQALEAQTPEYGVVIRTSTASGAEAPFITQRNNSWLLAEIQSGRWRNWRDIMLEVTETEKVSTYMRELSLKARANSKRLFIYPFGPKTYIFVVGYVSLSLIPELVWYSYPVPRSYDVDYSMGKGETYVCSLHEGERQD
ncbi:MAG: hypothetical protein JRN38_07575 [Nitrososphaerota archaeon]|nr:hypothetical protein [Nitrososphaerota archaeon]